MDEKEMMRAELRRLREAVNDLLESAQGGKYGEIICGADDFAAVEKLMETQPA